MFSMAMWMAALVAPVQAFVGDLHGLNTLEHQPAKIAALEGHFQDHPNGAPLILFGFPDAERETVHAEVSIPHLSSLILHHDWNAPTRGLSNWPRDERPPVAIIFWSFRIMVGLGLLMIALGMWSLVARWRRRLYDWTWLHRFALVMAPSGLRRGDRRLGHRRGRPPALGDLRPAAHRRRRVADRGARRDRIADRLRPGLSHRLRRRHGLHPSLDGAAAAARRARAVGADPQRRHHARRRRSSAAAPCRAPRTGRRRNDRSHRRLGVPDRLRRRRLCRHGRFRSRHRHPLSPVPGRAGARPGDELDRAGLGRQRDLAGAGRRRPARRFPARLCGRSAGALRAADRDAARAGLPRRRLRIPLARSRSPQILGRRLLPRLGRRDLRAGDHAGRAAPGHHHRGPRLCRRLVGVAVAVQPADRRQPARRLCLARRGLADLEDLGGRCRPTPVASRAGWRRACSPRSAR